MTHRPTAIVVSLHDWLEEKDVVRFDTIRLIINKIYAAPSAPMRKGAQMTQRTGPTAAKRARWRRFRCRGAFH